jgi:outer membrane protein assembly factor BamB
VECLDARTGDRLWRHSHATTYRDRYNYLPGPRATPAIEADRVYTLGVQGVLTCSDLATGAIIWQHNTAETYATDQGFFGFTTSPLIDGGLLILNQGGGHAVWAYDKHTGDVKWKTGDQWDRSYATPQAATMHGRRLLLVFAGGMTRPPVGGLLGIAPDGGTLHFRVPWRSRRYSSVNAQTPVVSGNHVFISTVYDAGGVLLEVQPDLTCREVYRTQAYASHWMTPILKDGYLYGFKNETLVCMDWATGEALWSRKLASAAGKRYGRASLVSADGRFLCLGESGLLAWLDLTPTECTVLSEHRLFEARQTWTAPVISHGRLYITQNQPSRSGKQPRLLCYDLRERNRSLE